MVSGVIAEFDEQKEIIYTSLQRHFLNTCSIFVCSIVLMTSGNVGADAFWWVCHVFPESEFASHFCFYILICSIYIYISHIFVSGVVLVAAGAKQQVMANGFLLICYNLGKFENMHELWSYNSADPVWCRREMYI